MESSESAEMVLAPQAGYLEPAMDIQAAKRWRDNYEGIKAAMLREIDYFDVTGPDGKKHRYVRRSGLQLLCNAFGIKEKEVDRQREPIEGGGFIMRIKIRSFHEKSGHYSEAWGTASSRETRFAKSQKLDHDVEAMAETRAKKRAQANMIGTGEVMMDEDMYNDTPAQTGPAATQPAQAAARPPEEKTEWHTYGQKPGAQKTFT